MVPITLSRWRTQNNFLRFFRSTPEVKGLGYHQDYVVSFLQINMKRRLFYNTTVYLAINGELFYIQNGWMYAMDVKFCSTNSGRPLECPLNKNETLYHLQNLKYEITIQFLVGFCFKIRQWTNYLR